MNFFPFESFFLSASGLFDFDLTFAAEAILFIILALVVTFVYLNPISKQIDKRDEFINFHLRKSTILLNFGYEKISNSIRLFSSEIEELNRQVKLVKNYTNTEFEEEVFNIQAENTTILNELKGDLAIRSAYMLSAVRTDLSRLAAKYVNKKFRE
jgi:F0F1-type ATP synthase membrane subunit b/b'